MGRPWERFVLGFVIVLALGGVWWGFARPIGTVKTADLPGDPSSQAPTETFYAMHVEPLRQAPDFTLTDQHGQPFTLSHHQGDVIVLFFGYTTCPDVCPTTVAQYRYVKELLGDAARRVKFVFVTVDPERDTPARLAEYLEVFDPEFVGLTGDEETLREVWRAYGVFVERVEAEDSPVGYWVNHSTRSYAVDAEGNLRLLISYNTPHEQLAHDLNRLVDLAPPPRSGLGRPPVEIKDMWARPAAVGGTSAVYFTLTNAGFEAIRLVEAASDAAALTEIHETTIQDDVMRMRRVHEIEAAPGAPLRLTPGGLHLMLLNLNRTLREGETIGLQLVFAGYDPIRVEVPVRLSGDSSDDSLDAHPAHEAHGSHSP